MEKLNYKPMNPDGQFNINFDEIKNNIPLSEEDNKELSTEYDLEVEEEDKKNKEEINKLMDEKDDPSWEYHGRFTKNAQDAQKIKDDLIRFNKEGGKTWDLNK